MKRSGKLTSPTIPQLIIPHNRFLLLRLITLSCVLFLGGCAESLVRQQDSVAASSEPSSVSVDPPTPSTKSPAAQPGKASERAPASAQTDRPRFETIWERLRNGFKLTLPDHPRVQREIRRLQRSPHAFTHSMLRAEPYIHHITERIEKRGMPLELALLPAVESGFRPYAQSPYGAEGLWQFMPATGRMLGLYSNWWYDYRRDVRHSTEKALDYVHSLRRRFDGDWLHALAAYNAGGGNVSKAIRKARQADRPIGFWYLDLPKETEDYVPRLLALVEVVRRPDHYGLTLPPIDNEPYFTIVDAGEQIDLKLAADLAGIEVEDLLLLNPGYSRWCTPPRGPHKLLVPTASAPTLTSSLATLPSDQRLRWKRHDIKPGDVLGQIAQQYGTSIETIQQVNGLDSTRIRAGDSLMIPLSEAAVTELAIGRVSKPRSRVRYQVRKGDSLYKIARKFSVKVSDLRRWNRLGRYLHPGQKLTVYVSRTLADST